MTNKKKILVVDDEIHIVHVIAIKFRNNGYEVLSAENGKQALKIASQNLPDLIVTDLCMPEMNGQEFVEKLREQEKTQDIPVILLTAKSLNLTKDQREKFKIVDFIKKPFSPKELLKAVENVLYQDAVVQQK